MTLVDSNIKIIATADLHGTLPEIEPCDILLIGGDVCPVWGSHEPEDQRKWLWSEFAPWLEKVPAKHIVGIAGNHDFVFEKKFDLPLPWHYLQDEEIELEGLRIYGTPWVPNLPSWAFYGGMRRVISHFETIPSGLDILLSHGPPRGYGDRLVDRQRVGCLRMAERLSFAEITPKVFVTGHIHEGYGHYPHDSIEHGIYNVAHMTEKYLPLNSPVELPSLT